MAKQPADPDAVFGAKSEGGFSSHLAAMALVLRGSTQRGALLGLAVGLVSVVGATAYAQVELNAWNQPFYDALARRDAPAFFHQLGVYGLIAGALLILNVAQMRLNLTTRLKLRESVTRDLFAQWLTPKRAFIVAGSGDIGRNPDQRIAEDVRHLTELSTDLCVGLFQAGLLLVSFIGVLWSLSADVSFHWNGASFSVPGYMVWCALLYAAAASYFSWRVGLPLVRLNAERYARESDLRVALVHVNDHCDGVAVYRGEAKEEGRLRQEFDRLLLVARQLVAATTNLTWVTAGYGWFTIIAPVIVAAPAYFAGNLTFGGLLMAVGAFTQVQQSLRWFVDNAGIIADWRATLRRVGAFRQALACVDKLGADAGRVRLETSTDRVIFDNVSVLSPAGCSRLDAPRIEVLPGERLLLIGAPGSGKTSLFRAMAGLWPWGGGTIALPADVLFLPKRPYIPDGALRDILAYPDPAEAFTRQEYENALKRMRLEHLAPALAQVGRWDRDLTDPEQQALAFARLLLHKPRWVVVDTAIETLSPLAREAVIEAFRSDLPTSALISIGGAEARSPFYTRVVDIVMDPRGEKLRTSAGPRA
jgi:putative ATP-binding cassette transporter